MTTQNNQNNEKSLVEVAEKSGDQGVATSKKAMAKDKLKQKLKNLFNKLQNPKLIAFCKKIDPSQLIFKKDPSTHLEVDHIDPKEAKKAKQRIAKLETELASAKQKAARKAKIQDNPYLKGREAWNDLYGSQTTKLENAYRIMMLMGVALIVAMIGFVIVAGQSKVTPYIVKVQDNHVLGVSPAEQHMPINQQLVDYFINKFITDVRSVRADNAVQKTYSSTAYALTQGQAANMVKEYFNSNDPFTLNQKVTRDVEINYTLPVSEHSYQVSWTERTRDMNGNLLTKESYVAVLSYKFGKVVSGLEDYNPFGIYITNISWNKSE